MNYQTMSTGEKRSVTNSLKKFVPQFFEKEIAQFNSKEDLLNSVYTYWVTESKKSKVAWLKTIDYSTSNEFKQESISRIEDLFSEEISSIKITPTKSVTDSSSKESSKNAIAKEVVKNQKTIKLSPLRSKKKRLRKKREKQLQLLEA